MAAVPPFVPRMAAGWNNYATGSLRLIILIGISHNLMKPPSSISDSLADADWDALAHALKTIASGVEGNDAASKRLRAQLGIVRMLMYEEISGWNGSGTIEMSFFIASFKTIQMLEKEFEARGIRKREFLIFLKLLFYKFEKQKLKVKKPLATLAEFKKMKGVVENGRGPL